MSKSANKGKKGSAGGKQSKQNQGNATAKKAKNGGKKKWSMRYYATRMEYSNSGTLESCN